MRVPCSVRSKKQYWHWRFWPRVKWHCDRFFPQYFSFPLSVPPHHCPTLIFNTLPLAEGQRGYTCEIFQKAKVFRKSGSAGQKSTFTFGVFCDVTPYRRFEETYCLHRQGQAPRASSRTAWPWWRRQYNRPKRPESIAQWHSVTMHNWFCSSAVPTTPNPATGTLFDTFTLSVDCQHRRKSTGY